MKLEIIEGIFEKILAESGNDSFQMTEGEQDWLREQMEASGIERAALPQMLRQAIKTHTQKLAEKMLSGFEGQDFAKNRLISAATYAAQNVILEKCELETGSTKEGFNGRLSGKPYETYADDVEKLASRAIADTLKSVQKHLKSGGYYERIQRSGFERQDSFGDLGATGLEMDSGRGQLAYSTGDVRGRNDDGGNRGGRRDESEAFGSPEDDTARLQRPARNLGGADEERTIRDRTREAPREMAPGTLQGTDGEREAIRSPDLHGAVGSEVYRAGSGLADDTRQGISGGESGGERGENGKPHSDDTSNIEIGRGEDVRLQLTGGDLTGINLTSEDFDIIAELPDKDAIMRYFDNLVDISVKSHYEKGTITADELITLRQIEPHRVSLFNVLDEDLPKLQSLKNKLNGDFGNKSPMWRIENGDWREQDTNRVAIINIEPMFSNIRTAIDTLKSKNKPDFKGLITNSDTNTVINVVSDSYRETLTGIMHYSRSSKKDVEPVLARASAAYHFDELLTNGILLDTAISEEGGQKTKGTALMHLFYTPFTHNGNHYLCKMYVEQYATNRESDKRLYDMTDIKVIPFPTNGSPEIGTANEVDNGISTISISQLYKLVKDFDKYFYTNLSAPGRVEKLEEEKAKAEPFQRVTGFQSHTLIDDPAEQQQRSDFESDALQSLKPIVTDYSIPQSAENVNLSEENTDYSLIPQSFREAMKLWDNDIAVYLAYPDGTEALAEEYTDLLRHSEKGGEFAVEPEDLEKLQNLKLTPLQEKIGDTNVSETFKSVEGRSRTNDMMFINGEQYEVENDYFSYFDLRVMTGYNGREEADDYERITITERELIPLLMQDERNKQYFAAFDEGFVPTPRPVVANEAISSDTLFHLSFREAMKMWNNDIAVYFVNDDGTNALAESREDILRHCEKREMFADYAVKNEDLDKFNNRKPTHIQGKVGDIYVTDTFKDDITVDEIMYIDGEAYELENNNRSSFDLRVMTSYNGTDEADDYDRIHISYADLIPLLMQDERNKQYFAAFDEGFVPVPRPERPIRFMTLVRVGDFYEIYGEEARKAAEIFNFTVLNRSGAEFVGVPMHKLDDYRKQIEATGITVSVLEPYEHHRTFIDHNHLDIERIIARNDDLNALYNNAVTIYEVDGHFELYNGRYNNAQWLHWCKTDIELETKEITTFQGKIEIKFVQFPKELLEEVTDILLNNRSNVLISREKDTDTRDIEVFLSDKNEYNQRFFNMIDNKNYTPSEASYYTYKLEDDPTDADKTILWSRIHDFQERVNHNINFDD
jgi:hypothetical protein